jgi:hypothetical protein
MINVRIIRVPIELDKRRNIVFTLRSFVELDEIYGSKSKALESLQSGGLRHVRSWLWAGLINEDDNLSVEDVGSLITDSTKDALIELKGLILHAASINLPQQKPDDAIHNEAQATEENNGWDWDWMYYMGTTLLGMNEDEFWRCTVRKLFALWDVHARANGFEQKEEKKTSAPPGYIDQFI